VVGALFDTNILIDLLRGRTQARDEVARFDDRAISMITWIEVMVGAPDEARTATRAFMAGFTLVDLDEAVAARAVELRRRYRMKLPDAVIWATAQIGGRLLVTRNTKDLPADDPGVRVPYLVS